MLQWKNPGFMENPTLKRAPPGAVHAAQTPASRIITTVISKGLLWPATGETKPGPRGARPAALQTSSPQEPLGWGC